MARSGEEVPTLYTPCGTPNRRSHNSGHVLHSLWYLMKSFIVLTINVILCSQSKTLRQLYSIWHIRNVVKSHAIEIFMMMSRLIWNKIEQHSWRNEHYPYIGNRENINLAQEEVGIRYCRRVSGIHNHTRCTKYIGIVQYIGTISWVSPKT